ncbi:gliding motility-associated C-terminal domain-containing protein [Salinimicrobium catena]|uniref:Gliding motility-associated C-terminal domain-containing protein n=1 Tax=Salinimicrobium catena TaxID=390640 RepID=A0A1H5NJ81_9FLAO|nr:gliding motility-associated C-terminal domain-containing protein [Salinimicrobium catena]SDL47834.1 gliding motility-associated C-terminal domain-containing protein [Salinimicrobium catena]SEF01504.1 gliding motility-associated C-terminal domain-containing protein [Salinimicrobium catena]
MQNFTLRRNGISLFLFAFILFSGTYSYGQTCPTVEDQNTTASGNQQYFCDSQIPEVQHLVATGDVVWYADQNSTTPIASTQLLADGITYFAGNSDATCAGSRESVTVTIYSQPDILGIKESTNKQSLPTLSFCVADVNNPDIYLSNIRTSADETGSIQWYDSQTGGNVLPADTELVNGATYWVDQANPFGTCRTNRRSVKIELNSEPAPEGEPAQTFCAANNPTLADIVASGDLRYFVSETSLTELSSATPLEDGKTYYLASVGEICVSVDRLAVTVTVNELTILDETQGFCETESATVDDLLPADGVWYTDETFSTPIDAGTALVHGNSYFLGIEEGTCTTTEVTADIYPAPDAGTPTELTYCSNDPAVDLFTQIEGTPDQAGTFEPALTNNMFNPADYEAGVQEFTYTVEGNEFCEDAVNTITINIIAAPEAGADVNEAYCTADFADGDALMTQFNTYLEGRDQTGTFNPTLESLRDDYNTNGAGVYTTVYTINDGDTGCSDSATFEITVNQTPDAGEDATVQLVEGDNTVIDLFSELGGTPVTGGTWDIGNGTFDPAVDTAPASYTYTVTANGCSSSATIFVAEACPIVADTTPEFCETVDDGTGADFPRVSDLLPAHAVWYTTADPSDDTTIDPNTQLEDQAVYYAGNQSGTCTARTPVTVTILDSPNAGIDTEITVCANDAPFDLTTMIDPSILGNADATGNFSPALASGGNMFDPAVDVAGTYTYTVASTTSCPDASADIIVNVEAVPAAPATTAVTDCAATGLTVADLVATPDTGNSIQWYTDAALTTPAAGTDVLVTGTYYATQTSPAGCESAATPAEVVINDAPTPTLVAGGNQFCMIDRPTVGNIAMNEANITWYDSATGGSVVSPETSLLDGTVYYASLTDAASGCESSQRLAVTAEVEKCPLPIPEAFSPNGDNINDLFMVEFIGEQYPQFTIEIFNRWGQKVFKGNASNATWNGESTEGSLGSDVVPVGVYFYVIEYNDGETTPTQGRLYLSR